MSCVSTVYIRSTDGGKTFGTAQKLAEGRCVNFSNEWNNFQADGPYIHVFYTCTSPRSLIYLRSDDYGVTFKPQEVISTGTGFFTPTDVYLTSDAGNLAIAWSKPLYSALHTDLICSYSTDGGATFHHTTIAAISDKYSAGVADIVRSGNYLYILAWTTDLNSWGTASRLLLYASWDGGATFKPPVRVTVPASDGNPYALKIQSANYSPNLFAEGNTVNIVWHNNDSPPTDYYWYAPTLRTCRSTDGGLTLTSPITLHTYPVGYDSSPTFGLETIAGKGSNLYIATVLEAPLSTDKPAGTYVWRSTDSGTSWGAAKLVASGGGWWPHIGVDPTDSSNIHLTNGWYFQSLDAGNTFTGGVDPHGNVDWYYPSMSISNDGVVHSCVTHGGAYNGHIYYRRIAPEPDPGSLNQALSLAKTSSTRHDNIQIPAFSNINFSTQMTVEFWVQRTSDNWSYFQYMVSKNRTSPYYCSYMIGAWDNFQIYGRLVTEQTNPSGTFMGTGITLPRDTWTHVAMTYDAGLSANNWKMYVNGLLANQMDMKGAILNETGFSPLVIGGRPSVPETGSMKIDELRLWNRPLSEGEIAQNMFRTLTGSENGLSAYYNFNDTFKELTGKGFDAMPMYWETFVPSTITGFLTGSLAASFAGSGLWVYKTDNATWTKINSSNPENMIYSGSTLYVDFGASYGLYKWDGTAWNQLTSANPENMVTSGSTLYVDFGALGLYKWDGAAWSLLTSVNPENMVASGSALYVDFGASYGLYKWDGAAWAQLTSANPENMVTSDSALFVGFGALGLYRWDGTAWSQLTSVNPENMVTSESALYVDFGAAYGLYKWSGAAWSQLTLANAESMVTSGSTLYVNFGASYGLYKWDGAAWAQLTPTNPENMVASGSMLYVDFGAAYGLYKWDGSNWSPLTGSNPDKMAVSN
jgi:hypothetical protein